MKKGILFALTLLLLATGALALNFAPTVMTISGDDAIQYAFDGSEVNFPLTVTGTPAAVWLVINTQGQGVNIKNVRNGYLGWHFVTQIDTTVYISPRYTKAQGSSTISWDGKDENLNTV